MELRKIDWSFIVHDEMVTKSQLHIQYISFAFHTGRLYHDRNDYLNRC